MGISLHNIINQQDKYIHNQLFGNTESENPLTGKWIGLWNRSIWVVLLQLFPNWTTCSPTYTKQYINTTILHTIYILKYLNLSYLIFDIITYNVMFSIWPSFMYFTGQMKGATGFVKLTFT